MLETLLAVCPTASQHRWLTAVAVAGVHVGMDSFSAGVSTSAVLCPSLLFPAKPTNGRKLKKILELTPSFHFLRSALHTHLASEQCLSESLVKGT